MTGVKNLEPFGARSNRYHSLNFSCYNDCSGRSSEKRTFKYWAEKVWSNNIMTPNIIDREHKPQTFVSAAASESEQMNFSCYNDRSGRSSGKRTFEYRAKKGWSNNIMAPSIIDKGA